MFSKLTLFAVASFATFVAAIPSPGDHEHGGNTQVCGTGSMQCCMFIFSFFPPRINSCLINFLKATLSRLPTTKMLKRLFKNWAFPFLSVRRSALLAVPLLTSLRVTPGKCSVSYLRCTPHLTFFLFSVGQTACCEDNSFCMFFN